MEVKLQDPSFKWNPSKALVRTLYGFLLSHVLRKFAKTMCLSYDWSLRSHFPVSRFSLGGLGLEWPRTFLRSGSGEVELEIHFIRV